MSYMANFGYIVTQVYATDLDFGLNSEIRYTLLNEPAQLFAIDGITGRIRVLGPINKDQRVYGFDVKATDRKGAEDGKSSITNVFVGKLFHFKSNFFLFMKIQFQFLIRFMYWMKIVKFA